MAEDPQPSAQSRPLEAGRDYYVDAAGRYVFTAAYMLARGYCCFLGCRHCPYGQAGQGPAAAFADLQRRLDALEERLEAAGAPLELTGYRNGTVHVLPPQGACLTDRPGLERLLRERADGLLTVCGIAWDGE